MSVSVGEMELIIGPKIPEGLAAVVEGLTREILRHQPENIYAFAAHHFDELTKLREKERYVISSECREVQCSEERKEGCSSEKVVRLLEEIVRRETRNITVPRKRREASNRSGWSIRETVKACKRYEKEKKVVGGEGRRISAKAKGNEREERDRGSGGFLRSSSTGDIVSKNRRLVEPREKNLDNCLKRQMSADRIEKEALSDERRPCSSDWKEAKKLEDRTKSRGRETKKSEEANLNRTLEKEDGESREIRKEAAGGKRSKDEESSLDDSTRERKRMVEDGSSRQDCWSVVFPSVVVARPVASSSNSWRDELCEFANEQKNLVLPPISADSFKPIPPKKGKNVMLLPSLSASEIDGRQGYSYSSVANEKETSVPNSGRCNSGRRKRDEGEEEVGDEWMETEEVGNLPSSEAARPVEENTAQGEEGQSLPDKEIFADSLNVTPDSMEVEQRPDSLEEHHPEDASATTERKEEEKRVNETKRMSSELKNKLIEIESVEKSIEHALASDRFPISSSIVSPTRSSLLFQRDEENSPADLAVASNDDTARETSSKMACCYVLTEGSTHEIPESVTTLVVSEKIFRNDDETNSEGESRSIREANVELLDPFGEYVCCNPESVRYTMSIDAADLLHGIKNTLDYATVHQDLANINEVEEEEEEEEEEDVKVETSSAKDEFSRENSSGKIGKKESETELGSDVRVNSESNRSDTFEGKNTAEAESVVTESVVTESSTDREDRCCVHRESVGPYVPELNFDSLQDATISSSKRSKSDSTNVDTHSERESEDIAVPEIISPADIAVTSMEKGEEETDTCPVEKDHDLDIEEEIARELIRNLALETTQQCRKTKIENSQGLIYADQSSSPDQGIQSSARNTQVEARSNDVVEKIDSLEQVDEIVSENSREFEGGETAAEETKRDVEAAGTIELWTRRKVSKKETPVEIATVSSPLLNEEKNTHDHRPNETASEGDFEIAKNPEEWRVSKDNSASQHSGELHDSLPLPLFELSRNVGAESIGALSDVFPFEFSPSSARYTIDCQPTSSLDFLPCVLEHAPMNRPRVAALIPFPAFILPSNARLTVRQTRKSPLVIREISMLDEETKEQGVDEQPDSAGDGKKDSLRDG